MNLSQYKNQITVLVAVLFLCFGGLVAVLILSNTNFYIKNLGTSLVQDGKLVNTITVTGDGKIFAKPDMAEFTVSISELAQTSSEALTNANKKIDEVMNVLRGNAIDANDIQTSQLSIYPEYDYARGVAVLKGQRATVSLNVKVKKIDEKATKVSKVIDEVSKVTNIQLGSISFDIEDKTTFFSKARTEAFNKAKQKAEELANLSGVKLLKPVSISDATYDVSAPMPATPASFGGKAAADSAVSTSVSTGQLEIRVNLGVIYGIE
jgi:uncharacterized protein YggE